MDSASKYATQLLLEQPGVAAVEKVEIVRRWGRTRSVMAYVRFRDDTNAPDVCSGAAQALMNRLRVTDSCLVVAAGPAKTASGERTPE